MFIVLRKYICILGMEIFFFKVFFLIFEINKFGVGIYSFFVFFWDVFILKCMWENIVNFGYFNISLKLVGSNLINW